ncbi:MAG: hypothetical protein JNL05_08030 [Flavobacteriales bacterium]|nr:hypothetical protein [Flavobacteriales bacterium]
MDLKRRLKLYLVGLLLGGVLSWLFFKQRLTNTAWMPEDRIKLRLESTLVKSGTQAAAQMVQWPTVIDSVRAAIKGSEVLFKETRRSGDSLYYSINATVAGRPALLTVSVLRDYRADSTATLWDLRAR